MVLEKTLESLLDCKEIQPVHSKGDQPWDFLEGMMLKLKLQYFGHLMRRVDSLEKTLMLGGIGGRRKRGQQRKRRLNGITDSMDMSLSELQESRIRVFEKAIDPYSFKSLTLQRQNFKKYNLVLSFQDLFLFS